MLNYLKMANMKLRVHNHKTDYKGAAPLPFIFDEIYEACERYKTLFRRGANEKELLFLSEENNELTPIDSMYSITGFANFSSGERS